MVIALWFVGCTLISSAEIDGKFGVSEAEGDTDDTGVADTGETGGEAGDTGDTSGETGVETGDTGTDTSDTALDTGDTGSDLPFAYTATTGATMILVAAGTFTMGGGVSDVGDSYVDHEVTLTHDFYLAQTETTRGEWESDPGNAGWVYSSLPDYPCTGTAVDCPADTMTWYDAAMYANWLSVEEGFTECYRANGTDLAAAYLADSYACPGYRLPTEAEWEYAARAGVDTMYSGSDAAADVAWTAENAASMGDYAHESCTLAANAWGFCDLSGNVEEWTNDWHAVEGGYGDGSADVDPGGPVQHRAMVWLR